MKKVLVLFFVLLFTPIFIFAADTVNINTASLEQLDQIIGVGPALAQRIIDARPFLVIDDLLNVKGIGEKTLQKIKEQGLASVDGQTTQSIIKTLPIEEKPIETPTIAQSPQTYPTGIIISELLPAPEGTDETNEWIELHNTNNSAIDISGWKLQDIQGTPTTYTFPTDTSITANNYLVVKRPDTKITLNNDQDGVNLVSPNGTIPSSVSYNKAPKNQSYNQTGSGWRWSTTPTPNLKNTVTAVAAKEKTKALSKTKKPDSTYVAAASEAVNLPDSSLFSNSLSQEGALNPWLLFLTATALTLVLGVATLLLKLKLFKKNTNI